jgi:hypothetical protein
MKKIANLQHTTPASWLSINAVKAWRPNVSASLRQMLIGFSPIKQIKRRLTAKKPARIQISKLFKSKKFGNLLAVRPEPLQLAGNVDAINLHIDCFDYCSNQDHKG